jgi:hypothetical protein
MMWARKSYFSTDAQRLCKLGSHSALTSEGGAGYPPHPNMEAENGSTKK